MLRGLHSLFEVMRGERCLRQFGYLLIVVSSFLSFDFKINFAHDPRSPHLGGLAGGGEREARIVFTLIEQIAQRWLDADSTIDFRPDRFGEKGEEGRHGGWLIANGRWRMA